MDPRDYDRDEIRMALNCKKNVHDVPRIIKGHGLQTIYIHYYALPPLARRQTAFVSVWSRFLSSIKDIPPEQDFMWAVRVLVAGQFLDPYFTEADLVGIILLMGWPLTPEGERRMLEISDQLPQGDFEEDTNAPVTLTDIGLRLCKDGRIILADVPELSLHPPYADTESIQAAAREKSTQYPPNTPASHPPENIPNTPGPEVRTSKKQGFAEQIGASNWNEIEMSVLVTGIKYRKAGTVEPFTKKEWGHIGLKGKRTVYCLLIEIANHNGCYPNSKKEEKRRSQTFDLNVALKNAFGLQDNPFSNHGAMGTQSQFGSIIMGDR